MLTLARQAAELFGQTFGAPNAARDFFCPGRVNLIGEHIDYNGGLVMPGAISLGIAARIRPRADGCIHAVSALYPGEKRIWQAQTAPENSSAEGWFSFPVAVYRFLRARDYSLPGFDIALAANLPQASGLSSSAALELLLLYSFIAVSGHTHPTRTEMALWGQKIENEYLGVACGIMDQFAVAQGRKNQALLLNCATLDFSPVPLDAMQGKGWQWILIHSGVNRALAHSPYNERRAQCDAALEELRSQGVPADFLCAARPEHLSLIADPVIRARARHAITEQQRVVAAAEKLRAGDGPAFGALLNASHHSLSVDYEVAGPDLDALMRIAQAQPGCLGARMTGAGFGGSALALIEEQRNSSFCETVEREYLAERGLNARFFPCALVDGVGEITI